MARELGWKTQSLATTLEDDSTRVHLVITESTPLRDQTMRLGDSARCETHSATCDTRPLRVSDRRGQFIRGIRLRAPGMRVLTAVERTTAVFTWTLAAKTG